MADKRRFFSGQGGLTQKYFVYCKSKQRSPAERVEGLSALSRERNPAAQFLAKGRNWGYLYGKMSAIIGPTEQTAPRPVRGMQKEE